MKTTRWFGLFAALALSAAATNAQPAPAPEQSQVAVPVNLSPGAAEVVRLATSGVGDEVVMSYIQNSQAPFNLRADDVLYLKDVGLSSQVQSAMINHDNGLRGQGQQYAPAPAAPVAPAPAAPPPMAPAAPAQAPVVAGPAPAYVSSPPPDVTYFYNQLSPYGSWVFLEGYGWCWQPSAVMVSPGWRPYCDGGYWVNSDAGWFWQSSYSWGWAPFHYGRWHQHPRNGWVWFPDRVWGPAWVTWRTGGEYCGWAPLPPHADFDVHLGWRFNGVRVAASFDFGLGINAFAFVGFGDVCSRDLGHRRLPPQRVTTIYKQTTIVNNYVVNNNTIVNRGVSVERVAAASHAPVPRATLRDAPAGGVRASERGGSVVYRHQLAAPAKPVNMVAQRVDVQHPVIQHTPSVPVRTERPSAFNSRTTTPATTTRRPATEAPRTSTWSSNPKSAATSPVETTPRVSQPAPTQSRTPAASATPDPWKQGTRVAPGYRSNSGLPARNNQSTVQPAPTTSQPSSAQPNSHVYYPKTFHQSSEVRSLAPADQGQSRSPFSSDSRSSRSVSPSDQPSSSSRGSSGGSSDSQSQKKNK